MRWFPFLMSFVLCIAFNFLSPSFFMAEQERGWSIEVVHPGDTLSSIASRYGTTIQKIRHLNGLSRSDLVPGQSLIIPSQNLVVHPGETLWELGRRHGVSPQQIQQMNKIKKSETLRAGTSIQIPQPPKVPIEANLFFVPSGKSKSDRAILRHFKWLRRVGLFQISVLENGTLNVRSFGKATSTIRQAGSTPYPVITNLTKNGFDPQLMHRIFHHPTKRRILVESIWHLLKANHFQGVMLDFEQIQPKDRLAFNEFLRELNQKLHPSGMKIAISLPPKRGDFVPKHSNGYDYKTIGKYADQVFIMAYDWHIPPYTGPGAIAPYPRVAKTMKYTSSVISPEKLYLGLSMYGYDWNLTNHKGSALSQIETIERAVDKGAPIHFDAKSYAPFYRYQDHKGNRHVVWFEDARSLAAKFQLVREMKWKGIGGSQMNFPFPQGETLLWLNFRPQ